MKHLLMLAVIALTGCNSLEPPTTEVASQPAAPAPLLLSGLDAQPTFASNLAELSLEAACPGLSAARQAGEVVSLAHTGGLPESRELQAMGWKRTMRIDVVMADTVHSLDSRPMPDGQHCSYEMGPGGFMAHKRACLAICGVTAKDDRNWYTRIPADTSAFHLPVVDTAFRAIARTDVLDIDKLRKHMKLGVSKIERYEDGGVRRWWPIRQPDGTESDHIEIKGVDLHNADQVSWGCQQFDNKGVRLDPARASSFCSSYFTKVLGLLVDDPQTLAENMLQQSSAVEQSWMRAQIGNFQIETDGDAYFIRHHVPQ